MAESKSKASLWPRFFRGKGINDDQDIDQRLSFFISKKFFISYEKYKHIDTHTHTHKNKQTSYTHTHTRCPIHYHYLCARKFSVFPDESREKKIDSKRRRRRKKRFQIIIIKKNHFYIKVLKWYEKKEEEMENGTNFCGEKKKIQQFRVANRTTEKKG